MPPGLFDDDDGFLLLSNAFDALEFEEEGGENEENEEEARTASTCWPRGAGRPPPPPPRFDDEGASFWNFFHCWYSSSHARSELVAEWLLETTATAAAGLAGPAAAPAAPPGEDGPLPLSPWIRRDSMGLALGGGGMAAAAAKRNDTETTANALPRNSNEGGQEEGRGAALLVRQ
jgi:hypothetical protein